MPASTPVMVWVAVKTLLSPSADTFALTPSMVTVGFVVSFSASAEVKVRVMTSVTVAIAPSSS